MNDIDTYSNFLSRCGIPYTDEASYTAWILAIQNARIAWMNANDDWEENQDLIQVKRMTANDLQSETTDHLPYTDDDYEQTLDVVRLPIAIPHEDGEKAPDVLFIRPDDIALFRSITNNKRSILIGNPGISKSWFQWKFILFCYRQDLFELLRQKEVKTDPVASPIDIENVSKEDTYDNDAGGKRLKCTPLQLPKFIVRTVNGEKSHWFALSRFEKVLMIRHRPVDLQLLTDTSTTVLWEPGESTNVIFSTDSLCKIIATVSPNPVRYHGFAKHAIHFYMPCPSELQIRLMGKIYRRLARGTSTPDDNVIQARVKKYGPFIRIAICPNLELVNLFAMHRDLEIQRLFAVPRDLSNILKSSHSLEQELKITNGLVNFSHRLARFVIKRDDANMFGGYTFPMYRFSCDYVRSHIQKAIANAGIDVVMNHLIAVNKGMMNFEDVNPYFLERVFELHSLSGIHWKYAPLKLGKNNGSIEWTDFHVKMEFVNRTVTAFGDMKPGILYYPSDRTFPLVDMYYKDSQNSLVCIQATMAKGHAKPLSTYLEFFDIVSPSENVAVHLYYLTLPCQKDYFGSKSISKSKFYVKVKSSNMAEWNPNLSFYCLLPPDTFESEY